MYSHGHSQSNPSSSTYNSLPDSHFQAEQYEMTESPSPHDQPRSPHLLNPDEDQHSQPSSPLQHSAEDVSSPVPQHPGGPIPRFYGLALQDDGPRPFARDSYASATSTSRAASSTGYVDNSSIRALNATSEDVTTSFNRQQSGMDNEFSPYRDDVNTVHYPTEPVQGRLIKEKPGFYAFTPPTTSRQKKRRLWAMIGGGVVLLILIIVIAVYFGVVKKHTSTSASAVGGDSGGGGSSGNSNGGQPQAPPPVVSGGDGTQVTLEDGSTFTYTNKFGGFWYEDPNNPFANGAKAQSWSPGLNETFRYGIDKIRGVNLGGWLTLEPFIAPSLFETYYNSSKPVDEWTLTAAMQKANAVADLETHYKTFITEQDFAQIAAAGLNFVRIPLPYWAIEVKPGEKFVGKTAWTYFLKAIRWARKYGIRINLDLHAVPGSQNGWNHSGRLGSINFLLGNAGLFNAQRTLEYIRVLAEFISQPQYRDVVPIFGILNEPRGAPKIGQDTLTSWYYEAYNVVRGVSGYGQGNGPYISYHDGFIGGGNWVDKFQNTDRTILDTHPYIAFFEEQVNAPQSDILADPCHFWGNQMNDSMGNFGVSIAGEFSAANNDCGYWLHGVDQGNAFDGSLAGSDGFVGDCGPWLDWQNWSDDKKKGIRQFVLTSMDALQNYFFWTWKIGNSTALGKVGSPLWSYQLGLAEGWMPDDPRDALGACAAQHASGRQFNQQLKPWQTGGPGGGAIAASLTNQWPWPPAQITSAADVSLLLAYTQTGTPITLPVQTDFATGTTTPTASIDPGNGWFNAKDTQGAYVPIDGCDYPDTWGGADIPWPTAACTGNGGNKREAKAEPAAPTPLPS